MPNASLCWSTAASARTAPVNRQRRREALLYRNLSTLRIDVPLPDSLEDLRWAGADRGQVEAVAAGLADPGLLERTIRYR